MAVRVSINVLNRGSESMLVSNEIDPASVARFKNVTSATLAVAVSVVTTLVELVLKNTR